MNEVAVLEVMVIKGAVEVRRCESFAGRGRGGGERTIERRTR